VKQGKGEQTPYVLILGGKQVIEEEPGVGKGEITPDAKGRTSLRSMAQYTLGGKNE